MRRTTWCLALLLVPLLTARARADATGTFHLGGLGRDHGWDVAMDGAGNLFVAGSSVFPTGSYVNPTLTIVALTHRLADHLAGALASGGRLV